MPTCTPTCPRLEREEGSGQVPFQGGKASELGKIIQNNEGRPMRAVKGNLGRSP